MLNDNRSKIHNLPLKNSREQIQIEAAVEKCVQRKMASWDLMRIDDVCKLLVVDPHVGFESRKIYKSSSVDTNVKAKVNALHRFYFPVTGGNIKEFQVELLELIRSKQLYMQFNIPYLSWIETILPLYARTISVESLTKIQICNRFKGDDYKGLKIVAKEDIKKNTKLNFLTGVYQPISAKAEIFLKSQKLDFSLMSSSITNANVIMLGPAAFINHDCKANCEYDSISKSVLRIKTIKNISAQEELFCFYGKDYFGVNNIDCECQSCEDRQEGYFSKLHDNSNALIDLSGSHVSIENFNNSIEACGSLSEENEPILRTVSKDNSTGIDRTLSEYLGDSFQEDFHGFSRYKYLDKKLNKAIVKIEKIDIRSIVNSTCSQIVETDADKLSKEELEAEFKKKKEHGYAFCIFCEKFKTQLPRHLKLAHKDKAIVDKIVCGKDVDLKNSATTFIRNQGYGHLEALTGVSIPVKNKKKDAVQDVIKVQCTNCLSYFSNKTLKAHKKKCFLFTLEKIRPLLGKS